MTARAAAILLLAGLAGCLEPAEAPAQPIPFDHSLHVVLEIDGARLACTACHPGAERGAHAGLPALASCLRCHMRPQGDPPSELEREIRVAGAAGGPFRWIQVTRNPGHVYFSHRAHVTGAGMACADCHGDVAAWREPPMVPVADLTSMNRCIDCHRERGAPTDCGTCHQ